MSQLPRDPELEAGYNVRAAIPDHPAMFARWKQESADFRAQAGGRLDLPYGEDAAQTLDYFPAGPGAPLQVFLHGGYWQAMDKADFSFIARPWNESGVSVAIPNYALCPAVSLDTIVAQMRRALAWLHAHAAELGFDEGRLQLSGHSAGGQLVAMMMATDWPGLMAPVARSAVSISGLFDLEPLRHTSINDKVGLDAASAERNSPMLLRPRVRLPFILAVGEHESAAFHAQSDAMAARWGPALPRTQRMTLAGCNHLTAVAELGRPGSALFEASLALL